MSLIIRKANLNDLESIVDLADELAKFDAQVEPGIFVPSINLHRGRFKKILDDEKHFILVAEQSGAVIGYLYAEFVNNIETNACLLNEIGVNEQYRSAGAGSALFEALQTECKNRDYKEIKLSVYTTNRRAMEWYEKIGFRNIVTKMKLDL